MRTNSVILHRAVLSIFALLGSCVRLSDSTSLSTTYPTCGDCFCVPALDGRAPCPQYWSPQTDFANSTIGAYMQMVPLQIYTLSCNPYEDSSCQTTPPQTETESDSAVCAYKFPTDDDTHAMSCSTYSMVTYPSREAAEQDRAILTHEGSCGLCSTTQDLAIYLSECFTIFIVSVSDVYIYIYICIYCDKY